MVTYNPDYVPEGPRVKTHEYYKTVNHVRLAKMDRNKSEFLGTVGGSPPDTIAPDITITSWNDSTKVLEVDITEPLGSVTVVWATSDTGVTPTYTVAGGWVGTTYETGSFTATPITDSDTIALTATTPAGSRKLTIYCYNALNALSLPDDTPITVTAAGITLVGSQASTLITATSVEQEYTISLTGGTGTTPSTGDLILVVLPIAATTARLGSMTCSDTAANADPYDEEASFFENSVTDGNMKIWSRISDGTETSLFVVASGTSTESGGLIVYVFSGVDNTTPLDVALVTAQGTYGDADAIDVDPSTITPVTSGAKMFIVGAVAMRNLLGSGISLSEAYMSDVLSGNYANGALSTDRVTLIRTGTVDWTSGAYDPGIMTSGATDNTPAEGYTWLAATLALRPA